MAIVTNNRQGEVLAMLDLGVEVVSSTLGQPEPTLKVYSVATREGVERRRLISEWGGCYLPFWGLPPFSFLK